jgi:hypothetical protein
VSAHDERWSVGPGTGSPRGPGPGETDLDDPADPCGSPAQDDGEILRAVTEFVEDLVEGADGVPGTGSADGSSGH